MKNHHKQINFLKNQKIVKKQFLSFAIILLVTLIFFEGARLVSSSLVAKDRLVSWTQEGIANIKEAESLAKDQKLSQAQEQLKYAQENFSQAKTDLKEVGGFLNSVVTAVPPGRSASALIDAGQKLSDAGMQLNYFYVYTSQIKASPQGFESPDGLYETLNASLKYLAQAKTNLSRASAEFNSVNPKYLPANSRIEFINSRDQLKLASQGISEVYDLISLMQEFFGSANKNLLVLFVNNNELRAGGGFIGTYGAYKFQDGKIINQKITSVYDLDGQIKVKIAPPGPYGLMTDHWGLRDSNWFADFAMSAKKSSGFYESVEKETPDAVVAITPDLFVDLLKITGPIDFPKYNVSLNADNFREVIQVNTSENYDKQQNTPKQMLADFAPLFLQKINALPKNKDQDIFAAIFKNLSEKNIVFYDQNPDIEKKFETYNWAGRVVPTDYDYLSVINSNIGGHKTDLAVDQKMDLVSEIQSDGSVVNTLTYTRFHKLGLYDQTKNADYIRFLVPKGSELLSANGFTKKQFLHSDGSDFPQSNVSYRIDPDLLAMDRSSTVEVQSGTVIGEEAGKTTFANWIETDPGQTAVVKISYKLPFKITKRSKYSLLLQKQPGNNPIDFSYDLQAHKDLLWSVPNEAKIDNRELKFFTTFNSDLFIGTVISD